MLLPNLERNRSVGGNENWHFGPPSGTNPAAHDLGRAHLSQLTHPIAPRTLAQVPTSPMDWSCGISTMAYSTNSVYQRPPWRHRHWIMSRVRMAPRTPSCWVKLPAIPPPAAVKLSAPSKAHNWYDFDDASPLFQTKQTFGFFDHGECLPRGVSDFAAPYTSAAQLKYYNGNTMTANINSAHSGGAVVAFFDGHCQFLTDDAGLNVAHRWHCIYPKPPRSTRFWRLPKAARTAPNRPPMTPIGLNSK